MHKVDNALLLSALLVQFNYTWNAPSKWYPGRKNIGRSFLLFLPQTVYNRTVKPPVAPPWTGPGFVSHHPLLLRNGPRTRWTVVVDFYWTFHGLYPKPFYRLNYLETISWSVLFIYYQLRAIILQNLMPSSEMHYHRRTRRGRSGRTRRCYKIPLNVFPELIQLISRPTPRD